MPIRRNKVRRRPGWKKVLKEIRRRQLRSLTTKQWLNHKGDATKSEALARYVFGWISGCELTEKQLRIVQPDLPYIASRGWYEKKEDPKYGTVWDLVAHHDWNPFVDLTHCFELVEKLNRDGYGFEFSLNENTGTWKVTITRFGKWLITSREGSDFCSSVSSSIIWAHHRFEDDPEWVPPIPRKRRKKKKDEDKYVLSNLRR